MPLPEFIETNLDAIVDDWSGFADQLMSAEQILELTSRVVYGQLDSVRL